MRRDGFLTKPLLVVVLIVLVDLMGFTIVMPLLPRYAKQYGFSGLQIGLLLAAFPCCQLIAGPILGRLSDRYGRRPVLAVSQAGTALSFLILGLSSHYPVMLLARILDGISGGNFLVAQAYIADVTPRSERARGYGLFGAAFGVGFVLGPLLAGLLLKVPLPGDWTLRLPFLVAAGFSTLAWVLVLIHLPESATPENREAARVLSWRGIVETAQLPMVRSLVVLGALVVLAFSSMEGTFSLYLAQRFGASESQAAYGFALLGLVAALVQGGLIRRLVKTYGEPRLIIAGLALMALGLAGLAVAHRVWLVVGASILLGTGYGIAGPSGMGLLSRMTPAAEQGAVFGVLLSAQTLMRMLNYLFTNAAFGRTGFAGAYWEGAGVAAIGLMLALWRLSGLHPEGHPPTEPVATVAASD